jgi:hypothetical protein
VPREGAIIFADGAARNMGPLAKDQLSLAATGAEDHFLIRQDP